MKVLISGCGTLGCELAISLLTSPITQITEIHTVDFDHFEKRNAFNQLFQNGPKSLILAQFLSKTYKTQSFQTHVQNLNLTPYDIVFSLTDTLPARIFCIKNSTFCLDLGVSHNAFSVRFYGEKFGHFIDVFAPQMHLKCSVEKVSSLEDLIQLCALDGGEFEEIYTKSKQQSVFYDFDREITKEEVRRVLRMEKQAPSIISKCCVEAALRKLGEYFSGQKVDDLTMGGFVGGYNEVTCNFQDSSEGVEKCVIYQNRVVLFESLGVRGSEEEIAQGMVYYV